MEVDVSDKEVTISMALLGAFLGVYFFDNVITAAILAGVSSYLTTTDGGAGEASKSTGACATLVPVPMGREGAERGGSRGMADGGRRATAPLRSHCVAVSARREVHRVHLQIDRGLRHGQ